MIQPLSLLRTARPGAFGGIGTPGATVTGMVTVVPDGAATRRSVAAPTTSRGTTTDTWAAPAVTGTCTGVAALPTQEAVSVVLAGLPSEVRSSFATPNARVSSCVAALGRPVTCTACRAKLGETGWLAVR